MICEWCKNRPATIFRGVYLCPACDELAKRRGWSSDTIKAMVSMFGSRPSANGRTANASMRVTR